MASNICWSLPPAPRYKQIDDKKAEYLALAEKNRLEIDAMARAQGWAVQVDPVLTPA